MRSKLDEAVGNNVRWCDAVCRAHGALGELGEAWWSTPQVVPRFYSNLITTRAGHEEAQRSAIEALVAADFAPSFSIKDSFSRLELSDLGFAKLFDASWIWRSEDAPAPEAGEAIRWSRVESDAELRRWEAAFSDHAANETGAAAPRLFVPALLGDSEVVFLAGRHDEQLVATAVANRSGKVVGLSNVFALDGAPESCWPSCVRAVTTLFPGRPIVGYEHGDDLAAARGVGFDELGPLRVWLRA